MKKLILAFLFTLIESQTFALSCARPEPFPALHEAQENYKTIGLLKIISLEDEDFISENTDEKFSDVTAEGNQRKFTTHKVKWETLKKGMNHDAEFLLKINATSWMGHPTKFTPGEKITLTTNAQINNGTIELNQDFGCGRNQWGRYSIEEIKNLKVKNNIPNDDDSDSIEKTSWERFLNWFLNIFE